MGCVISHLSAKFAFFPPSPSTYQIKKRDDGKLTAIYTSSSMPLASAAGGVDDGGGGGCSLDVWSLRTKRGVFLFDCNSDRSGEFPTTSSQCRRLLLSCASENYDDLIQQLVSGLESTSIDDQKQAAMELRLLAKNKPENRVKIARAGAIRPLISLITSSDPQLQEYGVTAILNLSLCDENKEQLASSGAIN